MESEIKTLPDHGKRSKGPEALKASTTYLSLNIPNRLKELRNESIRKQFLDVAGDLGFRQLKKVILKSIKIRIRITK